MAVFQFQRLPLDLKDIYYFYYYGNTEFAFTDGKKNNYDGYSQGLHGGLDFGHGGGGVNVHAGVDGIFDYGGDQKAFKPNRVGILVGRFRIFYGPLINL